MYQLTLTKGTERVVFSAMRRSDLFFLCRTYEKGGYKATYRIVL